jgi:peroxiredoxin
MPPKVGEAAPALEALLCDGDVFENTPLDDVLGDRGGVLYFQGFVFSAIARHWWKRFDRGGWDEFEGVSVTGVGRDGPFAQNAFLRRIGSPFSIFADVDGYITDEFGLRIERDGMAHVTTPSRSVFVLDANREVQYRWIAPDTVTPPPVEEIEDAIESL